MENVTASDQGVSRNGLWEHLALTQKDAGSSLTTEKGVDRDASRTPVNKGTFSMLGSTKYSEL